MLTLKDLKPSEMVLTDLRKRHSEVSKDIEDLRTSLEDKTSELKEITREITNRQRPSIKPVVTDHAIIRYLERVEGIDIQGIRNEILSDITKQAIKAGALEVVTSKYRVGIKGNAVTTILPR